MAVYTKQCKSPQNKQKLHKYQTSRWPNLTWKSRILKSNYSGQYRCPGVWAVLRDTRLPAPRQAVAPAIMGCNTNTVGNTAAPDHTTPIRHQQCWGAALCTAGRQLCHTQPQHGLLFLLLGSARSWLIVGVMMWVAASSNYIWWKSSPAELIISLRETRRFS